MQVLLGWIFSVGGRTAIAPVEVAWRLLRDVIRRGPLLLESLAAGRLRKLCGQSHLPGPTHSRLRGDTGVSGTG